MAQTTMNPSILTHLSGVKLGSRAQRERFDFDPLTGMRLRPLAPFTCFVEDEGDGDDDDEDDDPPKDEKTFTASQLEQTIKRRLTKEARKHARELKERDTQIASFEARIAEFEEKLEADDGEEKKKSTQTERELTKAGARIVELEAALKESTDVGAAATSALQTHVINSKVRSALTGANVLPGALDHAISLFANEHKAAMETDDDGKSYLVLSVDGGETDDVGDTAKSWLKKNPHFAAHPGGGSGEVPPANKSGGSGRSGKFKPGAIDIATADASDLIAGGMQEKTG